MAMDERRMRFVREVTDVVLSVMPGAVVMEQTSVLSEEADSVTAVDPADTRTADELMASLLKQLRQAGWKVMTDIDQAAACEDVVKTVCIAAKLDVGGGSFAIHPPAISFDGVVDRA